VLNTMAVSELFYSDSLVSYSLDGVVLSELTVNLVGKFFGVTGGSLLNHKRTLLRDPH
jgi:hypothetical protein